MNRRFGLGKYLGLWTIAIAMSFTDASAAAYLRELLGIEADKAFSLLPYLADSADWHISLETYRKFALLVVALFCTWQVSQFGHYRILGFVIVLSAWTITYYGWMYVLLGWPRSLLSYSVLYYSPAYWVAPVFCPLLLAASGLGFASLVLYLAQSRIASTPSIFHSVLVGTGGIICLYTLMSESSYYSAGGVPPRFPWTLFWIAYLMAVIPVLHYAYMLARKSRARFR